MKKQGGGFGIVILLVVLAVILLLAAKNWKSVMPTAAQALKPGSGPVEVDDRGQPEAGQAIRSGQLPNLDQMRQSTSDHADRVQSALDEIE